MATAMIQNYPTPPAPMRKLPSTSMLSSAMPTLTQIPTEYETENIYIIVI